MLALLPETGYTPEVLIVGGQNVLANTNLNLTACSESLRLTIALPDEATGASYTFGGGWVTEVMGGPRVMPDATILVSGDLSRVMDSPLSATVSSLVFVPALS